jgi:hypothetical protein
MMNLNTFGKTPAAEHLVRKLNEITDPGLQRAVTRSVAIAIKGANLNINEIRHSVHTYSMSPKVAANLLRLLREEALTFSGGGTHINDLTTNVIIGNIKRAIREVTVLRKIENVTSSADKVRNKCKEAYISYEHGGNVVGYSYDGYEVGTILNGVFEPFGFPVVDDPVTSELLHKRSASRRKRKATP